MSGSDPSAVSPGPLAAAILNDGSVDVDSMLTRIALQQRRANRRVRGLVMTRPDGVAGCSGSMVLRDLDTLDEYLVSQPLGAASRSCRADPHGFARASEVLRRAVDESPDLVISNRFGVLEAEGGGFRAELLELLSRGVPLLTVVAERHRAAWLDFTGGGAVLPPREETIGEWLDRTLGSALTDARTVCADA
jgi:hypothetical protein